MVLTSHSTASVSKLCIFAPVAVLVREFWVVDDIVMVYACEIPFLPFEEFRVFEDTESFLATGFLEPILGLQDEYNWKKNRASEYINRALKPDYIWSPMS